jgi:hypothetical protein
MLFLEKFADMFEAMASVLPPYHQIYAICKRRIGNVQISVEDDRLSMLMSYTFLDIVNMLLDIYRIFFPEPIGTFHAHYRVNRPETTEELWRDCQVAVGETQGCHSKVLPSTGGICNNNPHRCLVASWTLITQLESSC